MKYSCAKTMRGASAVQGHFNSNFSLLASSNMKSWGADRDILLGISIKSFWLKSRIKNGSSNGNSNRIRTTESEF